MSVFVILLVLCSCNSVRMSLKLIKGNLLNYLITTKIVEHKNSEKKRKSVHTVWFVGLKVLNVNIIATNKLFLYFICAQEKLQSLLYCLSCSDNGINATRYQAACWQTIQQSSVQFACNTKWQSDKNVQKDWTSSGCFTPHDEQEGTRAARTKAGSSC